MSMFSCYFGLGEDDQEEGEEAVTLERRDDDIDAPLCIPSEAEPNKLEHQGSIH